MQALLQFGVLNLFLNSSEHLIRVLHPLDTERTFGHIYYKSRNHQW